MDTNRRKFLAAGLACAGMAGLAGTYRLTDLIATRDPATSQGLHPFTQSLLERASRTGNVVDRSRVERVIHQRADSLGCSCRPVIKWLPDPQAAFDRLCRYGLVDLLQMKNATFWREGMCPAMDEETLERWCVVRRLATEELRPDDHDRALMAPKLAVKRGAAVLATTPDQAFEVRAIAAQVGCHAVLALASFGSFAGSMSNTP
jgi:hypothetical protein